MSYDPARRRQSSGAPSEREILIIETALSIPLGVPEAYAAALMFFRFDPGFRSELEAARHYWRGSTVPLPVDGLSDERRFDIAAALRNNKRLWEAAYGLATRWGLAVGSCAAAIAYDREPQYPIVDLRQWSEEPGTGHRYVEVRVYSAHVWPEVRRALDQVPWLRRVHDVASFEDRPEGSLQRVRGMDADVVARTLALHFLMRSRRGRPTGGVRTWGGSVALWRSIAGNTKSPADLEDPRPRYRGRLRLLRGIFRRMQGPARALAAIQESRGLGDSEWAATLGIDIEAWHQVRSDQAVPEVVWESIKLAVPEIANDLDSHVECRLLRMSTR